MHGTVWPAYLGDLMAASPPIACDAALQFSCICLVSSKNPNTARAYVLRVATLKLLLAKRMKQLCLVSNFLSPNFTIHLSHQISYLIHGALNVDK